MTIHQLNNLPKEQLHVELFKCCGATNWVNKMLSFFPVNNVEELLQIAKQQWDNCSETDWLQAFTHHPKIGDIDSLKKKFAATAQWAAGEQMGASTASDKVLIDLSNGNTAYEKKFGFIFIVCATGKSAEEMLQLLQQRLPNTKNQELQIAAAEQNKITILRIQKLLH